MLKNKLKAIIPSLVVILGAIFGINLGINNQDVNLQESNVEAIVQQISEIQNEEISEQNLNEQKGNFSTEKTQHSKNNILEENKYYYSKDDVALYIHTYNRLPKNFITKKKLVPLVGKAVVLKNMLRAMLSEGIPLETEKDFSQRKKAESTMSAILTLTVPQAEGQNELSSLTMV